MGFRNLKKRDFGGWQRRGWLAIMQWRFDGFFEGRRRGWRRAYCGFDSASRIARSAISSRYANARLRAPHAPFGRPLGLRTTPGNIWPRALRVGVGFTSGFVFMWLSYHAHITHGIKWFFPFNFGAVWTRYSSLFSARN